MIKQINRGKNRLKKHKKIRIKINGIKSCPRLNVFKSNKNIYAQIIDDTTGNTLVSASSLKIDEKNKSSLNSAKLVGNILAKKALANNIKKIE